MNSTAPLGFLAFALATALFAGAGNPLPQAPSPGSPPANRDGQAEDHVIRVYYFYTTQRCASCRKIEALAADAVRTGFEREIAAGGVEWTALNIDEAGNRHYVEDYKLYTKSVIVVDRVNGREVRWKNLPKIWELLGNEAAFRQYVQSEVGTYLEKRP